MTPLQRTQAVLPSKVGQVTRMSAAVTAFFQGPSSPAAEQAAARLRARQGSPSAGPGDPAGGGGPGGADADVSGWAEPPAEEPRPRAGQGGRHRLLPADLTVAAAPTRPSAPGTAGVSWTTWAS
jgi:hypothetical protein